MSLPKTLAWGASIIALLFALIGAKQAYSITEKVWTIKRNFDTLKPVKGEVDTINICKIHTHEWTLVAKETALDGNILAWKLKSGKYALTFYHIPSTIYWKHNVGDKVDGKMATLIADIDSAVSPERWHTP